MYKVISNRFGQMTSATTLERAIELANQHNEKNEPDDIMMVLDGEKKVYEIRREVQSESEALAYRTKWFAPMKEA